MKQRRDSHSHLLGLGRALLACAGLVLAHVGAHGGDAPAPFVYSPYKDVTIAVDAQTKALGSAVAGQVTPLIAQGTSTSGVSALTWAFANGECGAETWNGIDAQALADTNVAAFDRAGVGYILSTGGQGGVFTCGSDEGMERFIARYDSAHLLGVDFDIEHTQTDEGIDALVQRIVVAQRKRPQLRFSFTLATFAASDGSNASLNEKGEAVMRAIRRHRLKDYYLNLMVMDFGAARPEHCVVRQGRCDMAASAVRAARNASAKYGVPLKRIELTPMIGVNDVVENVFSLADAQLVARVARQQGLGGLHFWSLDRDRACPPSSSAVAPTCHSLPGLDPFSFTRAFAQRLGGAATER